MEWVTRDGRPAKRFLKDRRKMVAIHRLAMRYGVLPTEITKLPLDEWELLNAIATIGQKQDIADSKKNHG